jgi:hypothetical protein
MVERVLELKTFVHESVEIFEKHLHLTAPQWRQAQELKDEIMKKGFIVTKKLQLEDLTPGYFFRKWSGLRNVLQVNGSLIAERIVESMKKREKELLGNSFFLAAVYMDVRNMDLLSTEQKEKAHATVLQLVLRTKGLDNQPAEDAPPEESPVLSSSGAEDSDSDEEMKQARRTLLSASRPLSSEFEDEREPEATDSQPPAKKRKEQQTPQELCREKTREALELYNTSKPLLKKSKLPLSELIQKEYPGRKRIINF